MPPWVRVVNGSGRNRNEPWSGIHGIIRPTYTNVRGTHVSTVPRFFQSGSMGAIGQFFATAFVLVCCFQFIVTSQPVCSWAAGNDRALLQVYRAFQNLCEDPTSSRSQRLRAIQSLLEIGKDATGRSEPKGLFLAGKAYLDLYRHSGRPQDLDRSIRLLTDFKALSANNGEWLEALKELKTAYLLKRRSKAGNRRRMTRQAPQVVSKVVYSPLVPQANVPRAGADHISSKPDFGRQRGPLVPQPKVSETPARGIQGNPFFASWSASVRRPVMLKKRAALPSSSIRDGSGLPRFKAVERRHVIVIDPGHGGKDPGAVSPDGQMKEKDITLSVSRRLKAQLRRKSPLIKVVLTRSDDTFLTLSERTAIANSLNADLFISIHCNSYSDARAHGLETYYLSKAGSRTSMMAAARENDIPLSRMSDLEATLLDLMVTSKKTESQKLAMTVHESLMRSLAGVLTIRRNRGVKRAPFYVLLGATMPAILVECAYISNSRERDRLTDSNYLDAVAEGISEGALTYLRDIGKTG